MPKPKNYLLIIDGNAILHRAYHALPKMFSPKRELVNAVYGFFSVLLNALNKINPKYICATFDLAAPTFRHKLFDKYKATRIKGPQDLYNQLPIIKKILKDFNIPIFQKSGFEADDVIGTITKKNKIKNIILSGDLDTLQLVNQNTVVYTGLSNAVIYNRAKIKERYNLKPVQIIDFKALKGDSSDNIPGVPGIGEKTAIELLKKYKTLKNIYNNLDNIKASTRKKLEDFEDQAFFSQKLAKIDCKAPISFKLSKCLTKDYSQDRVIKAFEKLGFKSLVRRMENLG